MSTSLSPLTRPPGAQRTRTIGGRAAAKKLVDAPDLDRRAAHRSCTSGEPGTTFFRRTCRRQCPPARRSHSVSTDVALIDQMDLLASLYVTLNERGRCFCGNFGLFILSLSSLQVPHRGPQPLEKSCERDKEEEGAHTHAGPASPCVSASRSRPPSRFMINAHAS